MLTETESHERCMFLSLYKTPILFYLTYPDLVCGIPFFPCSDFSPAVVRVVSPLVDGFQVTPVAYGDAQFIAGGFHAIKAVDVFGDVHKVVVGFDIVVTDFGAHRTENNGIVGWGRGLNDHGARIR